ncbi:hypothetical protein CPB86DRAFT_24233 [Serendipita vermifera]|nr:hypothetical protein CPB86DRAFT_24233 [Serendipita vermifera]
MRVRLSTREGTAEVIEVARHAVDYLPSHVDVAGEHVVLVEQMSPDIEFGYIRLFNWKRMEFIQLPELLPVAGVSIFQDYLISVGLSPNQTVEMQILAFPSIHTDHDSTLWSSYVLAVTIGLLSTAPNEPALSPIICHQYLGREKNRISIWVRDETSISSWHIFDFDVDFTNSPETWVVSKEMKAKRVLEFWDSSHWALPLPDGKRFLSLGSAEDSTEDDDSKRLLQLSIIQIDTVPSLEDVPIFSREEEAKDFNEEQTRNYPKINLESPIKYSAEEEDPNTLIHSFDIEPWSGTLIILLSSGDIWVLRYGHV